MTLEQAIGLVPDGFEWLVRSGVSTGDANGDKRPYACVNKGGLSQTDFDTDEGIWRAYGNDPIAALATAATAARRSPT